MSGRMPDLFSRVKKSGMKILHLLYESRGDYFGIGGVGVRAYEIYKYLKEKHDITLLCKKYPGAKDGEREGLKHIFVGTESKSLTKTLLSYAYHAAQFVKRHGNEYDVIIEDFSPAIPTFLHVFTKKPIVLQIQGYTGLLYFRKYNPLYALILYVLEHLRPMFYENFIFVSGQTIKKLLPPPRPPLVRGGWGGKGRVFSFKTKSFLEVIPNGVSPELLSVTPDDGEYILYLGRIDIYGKGLDVLLKAYREFYKSFPGIRLVIAGNGRDRETFHDEVMRLPEEIRENIDLPGWVSGDKKTEVIRRALFVVLPSRHEIHSIAVLEVMACGKAVVVSGIPELSFVKEQRAGISFKTGDALSMAQSMKALMTSDERREMGQRGRDWVKEFTWDRMALKYEGFLYTVLEK